MTDTGAAKRAGHPLFTAWKARALAALCEPQPSRELLAKAVLQFPDWTLPRHVLAETAAAHGAHEEAAAHYRELIDRDPGSPTLRLLQDEQLTLAGQFDAALETYAQAAELDPRDGLALNQQAWILSENKGEHRKALALAEKSVASSPGQPAARDTLAWIHFRLGQPEEAPDPRTPTTTPTDMMTRSLAIPAACAAALLFQTLNADAGLAPVNIWKGNVGISIDAIGGNSDPVGDVQAELPAGSTVLAAYLYSAGTPYPWYPNNGAPPSPTTLAEYNGAGITLAGNAINNFDTLVGAVSDRADIGQWYTGRADVTSLVQSLHTGGPNYSWEVEEGAGLNNRIDGEVLVVVYEDASLPEASVALLDGGQDTGGESTLVSFDAPLGDPSDPSFAANMSLGISFSVTTAQTSLIDINGTRISSSAGGPDDGSGVDGGLITAGGIGDSTSNPADPFSNTSPDDELYDLAPYLAAGDMGFSIFTENDSNDDNIFMMGLYITADVGGVGPRPNGVPDGGSSFLLLGLGLLPLAWGAARRKVRAS